MLKLILVWSICAIPLINSCAYANNTDPSCAVLGVREPNSNTYDGPTFCQNIKLHDINVRGPLQVTNTSITGLAKINGPLLAIASQLQTITSENTYTPEFIKLTADTLVKGDIVFKGKRGKLLIDATSKLMGKLINGDLEKI